MGNTGILSPSPLALSGEGHFKSAVRRVGQGVFFGQSNVLGPGPMTALAAHVVGVPGGGKTALTGVVMLLNVGAVTLGAACIPVLIGARPMQGVSRLNSVIGVEVVPALSPFSL